FLRSRHIPPPSWRQDQSTEYQEFFPFSALPLLGNRPRPRRQGASPAACFRRAAAMVRSTPKRSVSEGISPKSLAHSSGWCGRFHYFRPPALRHGDGSAVVTTTELDGRQGVNVLLEKVDR